ncbi:MAG: hypothetical protein ACU0CO_16245 [Shimia sp.]
MAPELVVLLINAAALAVAYLGIYPSIEPKTMTRIMVADIVVSIAALVTAGALYGSAGHDFDLLLFEAPWWVFSILTLAILEVPLFAWFARRHGLFDDL